MEKLRVIERNLLPLVLVTAAVALLVPEAGQLLRPAVAPLLALLMLFVSLTFDAAAVGTVARRPSLQVLAFVLVYGPMSITGLLIGRVFFASEALALGQALVGVLPTDVSAPLLVLLGRGNVALAAVMNAVNTALAPLVVPALFLLLTGVELDVPVTRLILELVATIVIPMALGVWLRTRYAEVVDRYDPVYSSGSSLVYLALLLTVVGTNADRILGYGWYAALIVLAGLTLNLAGYALSTTSRLWTRNREERIAFLFTVSKKEFSIAAFIVLASGLPEEVAVPAAFYAVIQMITSPIAVRLLTRKAT